MMTRRLLLPAVLVILPHIASAQSAGPRWQIGVKGGVQTGGRALGDHFEFEQNVETGTTDVRYPVKSGALVDGSLGIRLFRHIGFGVAVSRMSSNGTAHVDAAIPHPLVFNQLRQVSGDVSNVTRTATSIHLDVLVTTALSERLGLQLSVGPTLIKREQEAVIAVQAEEQFPFDTATFGGATTRRVRGSATGVHVGADLTWMVTRRVGLGGLVRYVNGKVDLDVPVDPATAIGTATTRRLRLEAGGVQAGAGLRVRF